MESGSRSSLIFPSSSFVRFILSFFSFFFSFSLFFSLFFFFFFLTADSTRNIVRPAIKFRGAGLIKRDAHTGRWGVGRMVARGFYIFLLGVVTFFKRRGYHRGPSKSSRRVLEHDAPYARPSQTRPSYRLTLTLPPSKTQRPMLEKR